MKYEKKIRINRIQKEFKTRLSIIHINSPMGRIRLEVQSRMNSRQRRLVAISFFRQIRPWLRYVSSADIHHTEDARINFLRERQRGVQLFRSRPVTTPAGDLGFRIRMLRLENGWSQEFLAKLIPLTPFQLSRIERGVCQPRPKTLQKIENALNTTIPRSNPDPDKNGISQENKAPVACHFDEPAPHLAWENTKPRSG